MPRIFCYLRIAKNFKMTVSFMYNFRSLYLILILCDFLKYFTPHVRPFFLGKRKPKIFGFKNVMDIGIK